MTIFSQSIPDFPNFFVGGNTLPSCYILHIKFITNSFREDW